MTPHRRDHLSGDLVVLLRELAGAGFTRFGAWWNRLLSRPVIAVGRVQADDDILWDDGEPEEPADRR